MCEQHLRAASGRRWFLGGAVSLAIAGLGRKVAFAAQPEGPAPNAISPDAALTRLMDGNRRYVANASESKDFSAGRASRATVQYPFAAILGCADSRVAPELTFDQGPGDLFVVRVAGNFVNNDGLASLEYGVKYLGVPFILVLGHTNCGAVSAAVKVVQENVRLPGHLPELVQAIRPAVELAKAHPSGDLTADAIVENVRINTNRLMVARPLISQYVKEGKLKVAGGVYDLATGEVKLLS